jgi:hypothetical protein
MRAGKLDKNLDILPPLAGKPIFIALLAARPQWPVAAQ